MKRIRVVTPAIYSEDLAFMADVPGTYSIDGEVVVDHVFIETGTASIENYIDDALVTPATIKAAMEAEDDGIDGIIINCMCDPGVHAVREAVSIPVSGTAEIAMHTAAMLGHAFGFIDVLDTSRTMVIDQIARYGLRDRFGAFRAINIPVLEIEKRRQDTINLLADEAVKLVRDDHADVIILGCGALFGCDKKMKDKICNLLQVEICPIPIIDPLPLAINTMIAWVRSGLCHSKQAYPFPTNVKAVKGYSLNPRLYSRR
ncbi:MAG: hydrogenase expression protein HupH [Alphaproteobacteria bacterium]|nr:MAG: hydrogenase expression protein HupH [Alphaproteobacteria bacterium]